MIASSAYRLSVKISFFSLPALFMFFCGSAFSMSRPAIDWQRQVKIITRAWQHIEDDDRYENKRMYESRLVFENRFENAAKNIAVQLDGQAKYNGFAGGDSDDDVDLTLEDAFIEFRSGRQSISAGRQTITWGKLDDHSLLDLVNHQDYKLFTLIDMQERKRPAVMLRYNYNFAVSQIEAILMPMFKASNWRYLGSDFATFDHIREKVAGNPAVDAAAKAVVDGISTARNDSVFDNEWDNFQLGLRWRSRFNEIDYDLYYMTIRERIGGLRAQSPNGQLTLQYLCRPSSENLSSLVAAGPSANDLVLIEEYPRLHVFGADLETIIGQYGFRAEAALFLNKPFFRDDFSYVTKDVASVAAIIDHTMENNLYLSVGMREDHVLDYEGLFAREKNTQSVFSHIRKEFLRGRLAVSLDMNYNISLGDSMITQRTTYKFERGPEISAGVVLFAGDRSTAFGAVKDRDVFFLEAIFRF